MVLKNIKVTAPSCTGSVFRNLVLQNGIVRLSAESASTSKNADYIAGYRCELAVIRLLVTRGWVLECQRARTTIAEIDLIFSKKNEVLLIEVKTLDEPWRSFVRIKKSQYLKLQKNLVFLSTNIKKFDFKATVCWVDKKNQVSFVLVN